MKGLSVAFAFALLAFQVAGAVDLKPVAGLEVGLGVMDSGIEDSRGDSVPRFESGSPKTLDNDLLWGVGLMGGVLAGRTRWTCSGNLYGILAEDDKQFEAPGESVEEAKLTTYALSPLFSYRVLESKAGKFRLWLGTGYRYYVIHGILRMADSSGVSRTYENGYLKYHNGVLASSLDLKFTPRVGLALSYDRYLGRCPGDNVYLAFAWSVDGKDPGNEGRVFLRWTRSRGHYGALHFGLSGEMVFWND